MSPHTAMDLALMEAFTVSMTEQTGMSREDLAEILEEALGPDWPREYFNRSSKRPYKSHGEHEDKFVQDDTPRYMLAKGGEGGGKSVAGIKKCLDRLKRGMSGAMVSPDLPHFKRSLWPEFVRWCPWEHVEDKHSYRGAATWEPFAPFFMVFKNGSRLDCGGVDEPGAWEGPNINFAFMDEMRRKRTAAALKVFDGRVRIPGPQGEPPQLFITTTPRKHWLYEFFGPLKVKCKDCGGDSMIAIQTEEEYKCKFCDSVDLTIKDARADFKKDSLVITLFTKDNEVNLQEGFTKKRAQTLTESEARVLLDAAWEDIDEGQPFLPDRTWWAACQEDLPPLSKDEKLIVGIDAATGRISGLSDCFAIVGVTRHPNKERYSNTVAVRYVKLWQARNGKIDFMGTEHNPGPEREFRQLCKDYNVKCAVYDNTQLHDMTQRMRHDRVTWLKEFSQGTLRSVADTDLLHEIQERRIAHSGNPLLTEHILGADRKTDLDGNKLRLTKREDAIKIDAAVALSMAAYQCLYLNL